MFLALSHILTVSALELVKSFVKISTSRRLYFINRH
jgi:hypothetical protein